MQISILKLVFGTCGTHEIQQNSKKLCCTTPKLPLETQLQAGDEIQLRYTPASRLMP